MNEQRWSVILARSLERLHLAVTECASIGFEESTPTKNEHHAAIWLNLNAAQRDARLKLRAFKLGESAPTVNEQA